MSASNSENAGRSRAVELRKRIEQYGKRFTLKEGETLRIEMPYVED